MIETTYLIFTQRIGNSRLVLLKLKLWISCGNKITENDLVKEK
jgi:hypothetical protein